MIGAIGYRPAVSFGAGGQKISKIGNMKNIDNLTSRAEQHYTEQFDRAGSTLERKKIQQQMNEYKAAEARCRKSEQ